MPAKKSRTARRRRKKIQRLTIIALSVIVVAAIAITAMLGLIRAFSSGRSLAPDSSAVSTRTSSQQQSVQPQEPNGLDQDQLLALRDDIRSELLSQELQDLEAQINAYLDEHSIDRSKISWAVQDLTTGASIESDNSKTGFTAASTYKLPLTTYYYEQIAQGKINPDDTLTFTSNMLEKEDAENLNQPIHLKYAIGDEIPIDELLEAALLYSDNVAGHMLYENLGGYSEFKHLVSQYSDTPLGEDFYSDEKNCLSAHYAMQLLSHIYNTPGTFNDLKYWLQNATPDTFLNRDLYGVYIQKVGNINEVRNALGISNGSAPFSLSIFSAISKEEGYNILSDLGQLCYSYFNNKFASGYYSGTDQNRVAELNGQMSYPTDVVNLRPGPKGQTVRQLTPEEQQMAQEALQND